MSWAKPSAEEQGWRDGADQANRYDLVTAADVGVDSLGTVVASARSKTGGRSGRWSHVAQFTVDSLAVPTDSIMFAVGAGPDALRYDNMHREIARQVLPVALTCGATEDSILDAIADRQTRLDPDTDLDRLIGLAGIMRNWLATDPLSRRPNIVHPSLTGTIEYRLPTFLPMVRLIKFIENSEGRSEHVESTPIVVRASKNRPIGSLSLTGTRGAVKQGRSKRWDRIDCPELMVPLAELQIPNDAALQEFRNLFAKDGCTNEELLAFLATAVQPTEAMGGNSLVNLTRWMQWGSSIIPDLTDASRASIVKHYLEVPPAKRSIQFGSGGRVRYYGMSMNVTYQPPIKIEPFLNRMADILGVKRKPKGQNENNRH